MKKYKPFLLVIFLCLHNILEFEKVIDINIIPNSVTMNHNHESDDALENIVTDQKIWDSLCNVLIEPFTQYCHEGINHIWKPPVFC